MFRLAGSYLFLVVTLSSGQIDTLTRIQFPSGKSTIILNTYAGRELSTNSSARSQAHTILPDQLPDFNVMEGTHFTVSAPADKSIDVEGFPASTTVQLVVYKDKKPVGGCSGTLVGPNLVLSSAHCLLNPNTRGIACDEVIVVAAGKNVVDGSMLLTRASSAYVLKKYSDNESADDIVLLELLDPLGDHTGWMGIAFIEDDAINSKSIFHKFSYPTLAPGEDPRVSKGRVLHYNYGAIDVVSDKLLGIAAREATATRGQSGSGLFTIKNGLPYATGVAIYARSYQHQRITKSILSAFKPIIDQSVSQANDIPFLLYPNPVSHYAAIKIKEPLSHFTMTILNSEGAVVEAQTGSDSNTIMLDRGSLQVGEYQFRIVDDRERMIRGSFRVE